LYIDAMRALALLLLGACGQSAPASADAGADAGVAEACACAEASVDAALSDANEIVIGDAGGVTALDVPGMTPAFSPDVHDYAVRCAAGANAFDVTYTDAAGAHVQTVTLVPDEALVVDGVWVRCLPPDFPLITAAAHGAGPTPGWFLTDALTYAVVLDERATPVWYARGASVMNVDAQTPNVISMSPNASGGFGTDPATRFDLHALANGTTRSIQSVTTPTDAHELRLLANGDALLLTFPIVDLDGGVRIGDCEIQQVDAQGNLVWSWDALEHVDIDKESVTQQVTKVNGVDVVDVYHCNSIDLDSSGNLLLSMRHTSAVYFIDRATGAIQWKLGGTTWVGDGGAHIAVVNDPEGTFSLQHDARFSASGVTLFDDHGGGAGVARGVEYAIDHGSSTATPTFQFLGGGQSQFEGSFRPQADGHSVVGWGHVAADPRTFTEIDAQGNDVLDVTIAKVTAYRAVKVETSQLDVALLRATCATF
jgi:hypothetical protein